MNSRSVVPRGFSALRVVAAVLAVAVFGGCKSGDKLVWHAEADGFEHASYLLQDLGGFDGGARGPVYVRRKRLGDHCEFGGFVDDGRQPVFKVSCGGTWTDSFGMRFPCECQ